MGSHFFSKTLEKQWGNYQFCWLFNIGIESKWTDNRFQIKNPVEDKAVFHMEEILLLLARKQDILLLRRMPDERFLQDMQRFGFDVPTIFCPSQENFSKTITELILEDKQLLEELKDRAREKDLALLPYGVTRNEEMLAQYCGMEIIGSTSVVTKKANSKLYAREIMKRINLPMPEGRICEDLDKVEKVYQRLHNKFRRIIIKQPYGASGQGLYLVDSEQRKERILHILKRSQSPEGKWIVEGWLEKKEDLNAQLYIGTDGEIDIFSVKKQLLDDTVYRGSVFPLDLSTEEMSKYVSQLKKVGNVLYQDGVRGIVGIDSLFTKEEIFPVIEINVRFTLSTYLSALSNQFDSRYFRTMYYRVPLKNGISYEWIYEKLEKNGLLFKPEKREGIFCYIHACMTLEVVDGLGRLFVIMVSKKIGELENLQWQLEKFLEEEEILHGV